MQVVSEVGNGVKYKAVTVDVIVAPDPIPPTGAFIAHLAKIY
jgi:hypothetical protein